LKRICGLGVISQVAKITMEKTVEKILVKIKENLKIIKTVIGKRQIIVKGCN